MVVLPASNVDPLESDIKDYLDPKPYLRYQLERKLDMRLSSLSTECIEESLRTVFSARNAAKVAQQRKDSSENSCFLSIMHFIE